MPPMYRYAVIVNHDNGTTVFKVTAFTARGAKRQVLDVEKCPERSILSVTKTGIGPEL